jgi:hypothetical protein
LRPGRAVTHADSNAYADFNTGTASYTDGQAATDAATSPIGLVTSD